jgi:predicted TPR repeat methyltransferase
MSSGNLTADRRFDYARALRREGDHAGAAELIGQALELAPAWPEGQFAYGETLADAGQQEAAVAAYRRYLALDPADSMGAQVKLALLGAQTPAALPQAYVRRLFDDYAPRSDAALVEKLGYRGPAKLRAAVDEIAAHKTKQGPRFAATLDLGCGTGLSGAAFRDATDWLEGVDLSPAMVEQARRKGLYDALAAGDMIAHMAAHATEGTRTFDLVIAADVFVYAGDLAPAMDAIRRVTMPGALIAFTVQRHAGDGYVLGAEHRYRHSATYVRGIAAGFDVLHLGEDVFRQEKGADVPGLLAVLQRGNA